MTPQENLYLVAPSAMLDTPLPLNSFLKEDGTYHSITSYLATYNHTVERFSTDGTMFIKGFNWTMSTVDEVRAKCGDFNLVYGDTLLILNHDESMELLSTVDWKKEDI